MNINQKIHNNIISLMQPNKLYGVFRQNGQGLDGKNGQSGRNPTGTCCMGSVWDSSKGENDIKESINKLREYDRDIQARAYENTARRLELERLEREEVTARNLHEKGLVLARHEDTLNCYSFGKLLSAKGKMHASNTSSKAEEVGKELKESVEFGIAAARVAVRRKNNRIKEENEQALAKRNSRKNKPRKHINVVL
ncbi:hypothetical protein CLHUN_12250 [Ruminiclostridium hungatei]|uniref:Uncharacterized protein n=1 Tax=Ruminiclostridium hungatei TaxID=48256 RepID=A0A1V4SMH4_RUMHU|nr:hypothetical protein [Ruminiclostridium hungatei]OPX44993.1 hypothetical protein CLHUN_12250 [Ruminiclostridium hungatei]